MSDAVMSDLLREIDRLRRRLDAVDAGQYSTAPTAMTTYVPAWTGSTSNPTLDNGTLTGRYILRGNLCLMSVALVWGSGTSGGSGNWAFSLPFTAANNHAWFGPCTLRDAGTNSYPRIVQILAAGTTAVTFIQLDSGTNVSTITATAPFTWATADSVSFNVEYEIA